MFDKDLFLSLCEKYDVELSETATRPMIREGIEVHAITDDDVNRIFSPCQTLDMMKYDSDNKVQKNKIAKIYIEVDGGLVSNVYTDSTEDLEVILCDYDMADDEEDDDGYDFQSTKSCDELEEIKEGLKHIF